MKQEAYRIETDHLGTAHIPAEALYGIHAWRACNNFPNTMPFSKAWYKAMGTVKMACYQTYAKFITAVQTQLGDELSLKTIPSNKLAALNEAASEISEEQHFGAFIVPAMQGGAGTSINMNVNEILANVALQKIGEPLGNYGVIDPVEDANIYQSTNDVVPTALHLASMRLMQELEEAINLLRHDLEALENKHRNHLRVAYTQMQQAVPSSFGRLFGTYNEALSRDWWRMSRAQERLKVINLGGSAIGSGLTLPRYFIMNVVSELQHLTALPLTRSENMHDATSNLDPFVEVHGFLKAHAVNLEKMVNDLRMLSSDLVQNPDLRIPQKQVGSSIMPGKVNPVIPEFVIGVVHQVYANDVIVSSLAGQGMLDLNAYLPSIGHAFLNSVELLISANETLRKNLIDGLQVNTAQAEQKLYHSPSVCTALLPYIGYHKAEQITEVMNRNQCSVFEANSELGLIENEKLKKILSASSLLQEGFSIKDL